MRVVRDTHHPAGGSSSIRGAIWRPDLGPTCVKHMRRSPRSQPKRASYSPMGSRKTARITAAGMPNEDPVICGPGFLQHATTRSAETLPLAIIASTQLNTVARQMPTQCEHVAGGWLIRRCRECAERRG